MARGESGYTDPETGLFVFTALASEQRGHCCGRACRHCVWGHVNVPVSRGADRACSERKRSPAPPVTGRRLFSLARIGGAEAERSSEAQPDSGTGPRVVFFSGGKDSLLTLRRTQAEARGAGPSAPVVLLTTFTEEDQHIPEQDIPVHHVLRQARKLRLDLMAVPLPPRCSNETYTREVLAAVAEIEAAYDYPPNSARLVFGDLHLVDIRAWRESVFGGARSCDFPLFGVPYDTLAEELFALDAEVFISAFGDYHADAVADLGLALEDRFDRSLYRRLRNSGAIDAFGENGEFHTRVDLH
jgi:ATP-binding cassette subfamily B (MDR/TAP) protein 1